MMLYEELTNTKNDFLSGESSLSISNSELGVLDPKTETYSVLQHQYSLIHESYKEEEKKPQEYCCANERTRPWILRISFLLVIALALAISYLELRFSTYAPRTASITSGDQLLLPISTYLNKRVNFQINNTIDASNVKLYVLESKPNISSAVVRYHSGAKFHMPSWTYQYWGFYLLSGSTVKISICSDLQIQFYIIKGLKKLESWEEQILFDGYDYHRVIFAAESCNGMNHFKTHVLLVEDSDTYFILFSSTIGWRFLTTISLVLQFNRTSYDLSNTKYSCLLSSRNCSAALGEGTTDISLLETIPNHYANPFHTIHVQYIPISRHYFYLKVFGGIYATVLSISALYIIWRTFVNLTRSREKKPLLSHMSTQRYSSDKPWVVVSTIDRINSREAICRVEEKETHSVLGEEHGRSLMVDSVNSRDFMRQNESANYVYRNEYNNTQQLIDTCLTSAGASAI